MLRNKWIIIIVIVVFLISFFFYALTSFTSPPDFTRSLPLNCPSLLDMEPKTPIYNSTAVECVQGLIERCQTDKLILYYSFGSMQVSIQGQKDDKCFVQLVHEIEMGKTTFSCSIPFTELKNWKSWKDSGGAQAVDDILPFCNRD